MAPPQTSDLLERIRQDWAQTQPDLDPGPMLPLLLLGRLHTALVRQIETTYQPAGINPAGWDLLLTLYRSAPPEGLTPTQLTDLTAISGPSITNRVDRLVQKGLAERLASESDRRSVQVRLTPAGRALVEELLPHHVANEARILSALTPAETQTLERLALKLLAELEAPEPLETPAH
ncbi:MarR family transcriptional regulator (plasmid) [Deinococcus metallilatus]|uniref:MarR family transcriptional regulator n=2 Tax=Deinococcus TaxID=1298 RepID=A0AAJ5F5X7_9DEIO|nr:MarR family transcriptional regulator [Deinococcus metallilatus]MBB5293243.1 DNA-binding MarR family transcriptional regulator [Deinococcus metallilatus]QBY07030.1 MarR family transcriptional regulator [Deinococcus metallilatus]RXJ18041.1 MarR family transcriptional regulator [Deinococcus metallilatus]TLK31977.1 MarR family transcriptional regulator [Deinococcus metallilatus]GMA15533.1 MarR family transcriptional regulator [Deinococcus metallilatus]